jgi:hydroxymethylpyrimidine/phosphomethylpyrimidine kinase
MQGRVLVVAGSDSGGGAGIQADIKTITALGAYAATAVTALTAQNTLGVFGVLPVDPAFIRRQMEVVLEDIGADCIKIGMLHDAAVIGCVADVLEALPKPIPLVLDPVMVAKGGASLLDPDAVESLKRRLLPHAAVLTPNLPEAEALTGIAIQSVQDMMRAARMLLALGPGSVLVKGGHLDGPVVSDVLVDANTVEIFENPRIESRHTHGTGCTLASAIAAGLARGLMPKAAVTRARTYLRAAILSAPGYGRGHGPLDHAHVFGAR